MVVGTYYSLKNTNFKTQVILVKLTKKARTLIITKAELIAGNVNQVQFVRHFFVNSIQWLILPCVIDVRSQFLILRRVDVDRSLTTFLAGATNEIFSRVVIVKSKLC